MTTSIKAVFWRSFFVLSLVFVILILRVNTTRAQEIFVGNIIPAGTTIENEAILIDDTVVVDGNVNGDVLAVGSEISINGSINGSLIALGETVIINGDINGTVYSTALSVDLEESASLNRNLYFAGLSLITKNGSSIGRDLYAATLGATLEGSVERDITAIIGPVEFIKLIMRLIEGGQSQSSTTSSIRGLPTFSVSRTIFSISYGVNSTSNLASLLPVQVILLKNNNSDNLQTSSPSNGIDVQRLKNWALERVREFLALLAFGLLAIWIFPSLFSGSIETVKNKPLPAFGWGLLFLVISFNIIALSFLLAGLVFIVGLWLGMATLWSLAFVFWLVGMSGLTLAATLFTIFVLYVSKSVVAFVGAKLVLDVYFPRLTQYKLIPLILGLIVFVLLHSISLIGSVISVLVTAFGLGIVWLTWRNNPNIAQNRLKNNNSSIIEEAVSE